MRKRIVVLIVAAALSACAIAPTNPDSTGGAWVLVGDASAHQRAANQLADAQPPKQVFWFLAGR